MSSDALETADLIADMAITAKTIETNVHVPPLVSDAKDLIAGRYPKLCKRFDSAFQSFDDGMSLRDAVDAITGDFNGWVKSMPEKMRNDYAIKRAKYGIWFVLDHEAIKDALGAEYCANATIAIENAWEECKGEWKILAKEAKEAKEAAAGGGGGRAGSSKGNASDGEVSAAAAGAAQGFSDVRTVMANQAEKIAELQAANNFLSRFTVAFIEERCGPSVATLVKQLLDVHTTD